MSDVENPEENPSEREAMNLSMQLPCLEQLERLEV